MGKLKQLWFSVGNSQAKRLPTERCFCFNVTHTKGNSHMCVWLLICWVCMLGGSFIEHNTNLHSIFHTHTHLFTYTHAVIYTTLSSDICHHCHRKPGAPSSTGDTRVAWSWPTPRSAAVHHQRADAHTCVYTCFEITVLVKIKTVEHAFSTGCAVRALLSKSFSGVVSR